jgi:hypothetical protein
VLHADGVRLERKVHERKGPRQEHEREQAKHSPVGRAGSDLSSKAHAQRIERVGGAVKAMRESRSEPRSDGRIGSLIPGTRAPGAAVQPPVTNAREPGTRASIAGTSSWPVLSARPPSEACRGLPMSHRIRRGPFLQGSGSVLSPLRA